jgi:hypothetical protein
VTAVPAVIPKPPTADQLIDRFSQEEDADYVATLLILLIDSVPALVFHSVEHEFPNGAKADVAAAYASNNGGLIFEIKSKRDMNAVAAYETDKIAKQVIRYASTLSGWDDPSGQARNVKDFCDIAEIVHSVDIEKYESEVSSKLSSLDGPQIRPNGLVFCSWEKVEVRIAYDIRARFYKGGLSEDTVLSPLKTHNGFNAPLHDVIAERNNRNIHLEFQSEHRLIVAIMEKIWGIHDFRTGLSRSRPLHSAVNDYFIQKGRIYFTLDCLDFHFHWVPTGRRYCAKVKRDRLRQTCEQMVKLGILNKHDVGNIPYYSMSIVRKNHNYLRDVCESYSIMLDEEHILTVAKQEASSKATQSSLDSFPSKNPKVAS